MAALYLTYDSVETQIRGHWGFYCGESKGTFFSFSFFSWETTKQNFSYIFPAAGN